MPPKKGSVKNVEERRKIKREAERRRRAKIKADPEKYEAAKSKERERRKRRKAEKKILSIEELAPRDQRAQRKEWRDRQRKSREKKKCRQKALERHLRDNTPSTDVSSRNSSPSANQCGSTQSSVHSGQSSVSRQRIQGMKQAKLHREINLRIIKKHTEEKAQLKAKIHSLQVKYNRLLKMLPPKAKIVKKKLPVCFIFQKKKAICDFLEDDSNTRLCPGKKDTKTKNKIKKQRRIYMDTLERLHKKYNAQSTPSYRVSYATFCRISKSFYWIRRGKLTERDTCLCMLCENTDLLIKKLHTLKIIEANNIETLISNNLVCHEYAYKCMSQKCCACSERTPTFFEFEDEHVTLKQWTVRNETRIIRGKEKIIKRTVLNESLYFKKELINKLIEVLPRILKHIFNIKKQCKTRKIIKENLRHGEILMHIDFSENYSCKYFRETQSVHFGASRQQVSLHTGVLYFKPEGDSATETESISFCTVSDCLRHDASAVYAHIKKALLCLTKDQKITGLHVASDGPSSQYKNKKNFYLFTQHLLKTFDISEATWNFSESGHGKGAPDGVGASIKQTADFYVSQGNDIPDYATFYDKVKARSNVLLYEVSEEEIAEGDELLKSWKAVNSIPGTKNMHQLTWVKEDPYIINFRELSCMECSIHAKCTHFPTSKHKIVHTTQQSVDNDDVINNADNVSVMSNHVDEDINNADIEKNANEHVNNDEVVNNNDNETDSNNDSMKFANTIASDLRVGVWVLVKFTTKTKEICYVGQIVSAEEENPDATYVVKFTRKKLSSSRDVTFVWKDNDFSEVNASEVISILPEPTLSRRGSLLFKFDFTKCNYLVM